MTETLFQMAVLIACGTIWRWIRPAGLGAEETRKVLTSLVYYVLLPALILDVMWRSKIDDSAFHYSILGVACIVFGIMVVWLYSRVFSLPRPQLGAVILATSFPNVTYLGLPVMVKTFGEWSKAVVIQLDVFAASPMLLTVGIMIARYYGRSSNNSSQMFVILATVPAFWVAGIGLALNFKGVQMPEWVAGVLKTLAGGMVPLMLFSLGLAISWSSLRWRNIPYVLPAIVIKLALMPLFAWYLVGFLTFSGQTKVAVILEMAMPSMVMGIVFCDRYKLDSSLYAMIVTVTTLLSLLSLPFWYRQLI